MGLSLEVGILADLRENDEEGYQHFRDQFDALNTHLSGASLPLHDEPVDCDVWSCEMFGYSGLHYLRRIAAHLDSSGQLPDPGSDNASEDLVLKQYFEHVIGRKPPLAQRIFAKQPRFLRAFDHLIVHSDAEGFYLPIEFSDVLYPDEKLEVAGGMIGSAVRLLDECKRIANVLEIPSDLDETSDALWEAADSQGEGERKWQRYGIESFSCVCLMRGCIKSIDTKAALVFV